MGIGASSVMWDTTLDELCHVKPRDLQSLGRVPGFGEKKLESLGQQILDALRHFRDGDRASNEAKQEHLPLPKKPCACSKKGTRLPRLLRFARERCAPSSPWWPISSSGRDTEFQPNWLAPERYEQIAAACRQLGNGPPQGRSRKRYHSKSLMKRSVW